MTVKNLCDFDNVGEAIVHATCEHPGCPHAENLIATDANAALWYGRWWRSGRYVQAEKLLAQKTLNWKEYVSRLSTEQHNRALSHVVAVSS